MYLTLKTGLGFVCLLLLLLLLLKMKRLEGAADFTVEVQNSERKKNLVPPFFQIWRYKQANINRGLLNIFKIRKSN